MVFNFSNKGKGPGEAAGHPGWYGEAPRRSYHSVPWSPGNTGKPGVESFQGLVSGLLLQAAHSWVASHRHSHCAQHQGGDGLYSQDIDLGPLGVFLERHRTCDQVTSSQTSTTTCAPTCTQTQSSWLSEHVTLWEGALSATVGPVLSAYTHHSHTHWSCETNLMGKCPLFKARSPIGTNLRTGITYFRNCAHDSLLASTRGFADMLMALTSIHSACPFCRSCHTAYQNQGLMSHDF